MRATMMMTVGLLVVGGGLTGCTSSLKATNKLLTEENTNLRGQLEERNSALDSTYTELRDKERQLAEMQRDLDSANALTAQPLANTPFDNIPGVTGSVGSGEVTATVANDVLFGSGRSKLKSSARQSLDQVISVLNSSYATAVIRIEGHTDTDPIKKSGFKSNYHLGFERAYAVRQYLISKGISSNRVYLASHGPDEPMGTKEKSRRVDIVVVLN